jgi:hypothetical protein
MKLVYYAEWAESQIMMECRHSLMAGDQGAAVCLKEKYCTCLTHKAVLPGDEKPELTEEQIKERAWRTVLKHSIDPRP